MEIKTSTRGTGPFVPVVTLVKNDGEATFVVGNEQLTEEAALTIANAVYETIVEAACDIAEVATMVEEEF